MNVFMTIPVAEAKKKAQKVTRQDDLSLVKISPLSLPSSEANLWRCQCINILHIREPGIFPPPPKKAKRKLSIGMSFPKSGGVSQSNTYCQACGQAIRKDSPK